MGRKPKQLPPNDPDRFVHWMARGRNRWNPDVIPALLTWLSMLEEQHQRAKADLMGKHHKLPPAVLNGMTERIDGILAALTILAESVNVPFSRVDWNVAASRVMGVFDRENPGQEAEAPTGG